MAFKNVVRSSRTAALLILAGPMAMALICPGTFGAETTDWEELGSEYAREVRPLLQTYCVQCHSTQDQQGDLDLEQFATLADVRQGVATWIKVTEQLDAKEMPPADEPQPSSAELEALRGWVRRDLRSEALARAGDPGPVVLRRLNNVEYTWTIRDLTGTNLDPAREFPVDSAAGEGFTNAGSAQSMSPALLTKYLDAGKGIARHVVLLPDGFRFSPHTTPRDWIDEILAKIRAFYGQYVETADLKNGTPVGIFNLHSSCNMGLRGYLPLDRYFTATIADRDTLQLGDSSIDAVAAARGLNAKYLKRLWETLTADNAGPPSPLLDQLRRRWRDARTEDVAALTESISQWQAGLWTYFPIAQLGRKGSHPRWLEEVSPIVSQHEMRLKFDPLPTDASPDNPNDQKPEDAPKSDAATNDVKGEVVFSLVATDAGDGNEHDHVIWRNPRLVADKQADILLRDIEGLQGVESHQFGKRTDGQSLDDASLAMRAPSVWTIRIPHAVAAGRELVVTAELDPERGAEEIVQVALVSGTATVSEGLLPSRVTTTFSSVTALHPDGAVRTFERPLLMASGNALKEVWEKAMHDHRQIFPPSLCYPKIVPADEVLTLTQYYREDDHLIRLVLDESERQKIDRLWEELRFVSREPLKYSDVLESFVEIMSGQDQNGTFDKVIEPTRQRVAQFRQELVDAEPRQLDSLMEFAARAYRRPLESAEKESLRGLYHQLRTERIEHDEAFRLTLARVFCASPFLFRIEDAPADAEPAPVTDWELASRLSYFLWSSLPDETLRAAAVSGKLHEPQSLLEQTRRMLKESRVRRLATEFGCQWLHIHEFPITETKSVQLFPEFAELKEDMYEESILFLTHVFQDDASLLHLLDADYTFVNQRLADFYGLSKVAGDLWQRVEGVRALGRGGILAQATTLAKQSGASRTSPILRGNWVSEVLLGEKLPRPPKDVPPLSDTVPEGLTERQLIERHSSDAACAKCHRRVDPIGFALEGFDAIGRRRERNQAGVPIDTQTTLADGHAIDGLDGLRDYLLNQRRDVIIGQFCRKLLGYALGREVQLSDSPLLEDMRRQLAQNDYRASVAVELVVMSPQFTRKRASE